MLLLIADMDELPPERLIAANACGVNLFSKRVYA